MYRQTRLYLQWRIRCGNLEHSNDDKIAERSNGRQSNSKDGRHRDFKASGCSRLKQWIVLSESWCGYMLNTVKIYWADVSSVSPSSQQKTFLLLLFLLWRRANAQKVSSINLHGVQHVPTSTFSWYNSLFYSLRRHRSTLVLTGTSILLFAFSLVFSDLVCFSCGAGEPKANQGIPVRFVFFYRWFSDNIELCLKKHSETKRKKTKTKTNKQTNKGRKKPSKEWQHINLGNWDFFYSKCKYSLKRKSNGQVGAKCVQFKGRSWATERHAKVCIGGQWKPSPWKGSRL